MSKTACQTCLWRIGKPNSGAPSGVIQGLLSVSFVWEGNVIFNWLSEEKLLYLSGFTDASRYSMKPLIYFLSW